MDTTGMIRHLGGCRGCGRGRLILVRMLALTGVIRPINTRLTPLSRTIHQIVIPTHRTQMLATRVIRRNWGCRGCGRGRLGFGFRRRILRMPSTILTRRAVICAVLIRQRTPRTRPILMTIATITAIAVIRVTR